MPRRETAQRVGETARHRRRAGRTAAKPPGRVERPVRPGMAGGAYRPLARRDLEQIHHAALEILDSIGIADAPPELVELARAKGCRLDRHGRLSFPGALIEDIVAGAAKGYVVYSRSAAHDDLHMGGDRVYFATSGEAVTMFDSRSRSYRPSTLVDLYDSCRLVDRLEHIHQFGQTIVPTEIDDLFEHDLNVAYALVCGTEKPVGMSFNRARNIRPALELFDRVLGGEGRFKERPFCTFGGCPIVSPLRFGTDNLEVLVETSRLGLVNDIAIAPQAGATAPAALAGTLAQVTAEALACLAVVNLIRPGCPMSFALWPFVCDLRSGAFSGGGGEQAVLAAAAAQIARFYDLPNSVAASMTDSKIPDAQAGYEKGITAALAGLAGGNCVSEAAGGLASLMACSFEALVIDDDMLGMVQRALRGIEVSDETLGVETIREAVLGPGHFLGHPDTLARMRTEYLYPRLADRQAAEAWREAGAKDMLERARERVAEILSSHYPAPLDAATDEAIRERFPIRLPREAMRPDGGRW